MGSSEARDQLVRHQTEPARVDDATVELSEAVGPGEESHEQEREVGVGGILTGAIRQAAEKRRELADDLGVERGDPAAELRAAQRRDADLGEQHVLRAVRRHLEEEVVERTCERALRIEDGDLRHERLALLRDHLVDGGDQERFLRREVVVDEPGGHARLLRDALDRGVGEPVLHDRGAQPLDDLTAARLREARASHRLIG